MTKMLILLNGYYFEFKFKKIRKWLQNACLFNNLFYIYPFFFKKKRERNKFFEKLQD